MCVLYCRVVFIILSLIFDYFIDMLLLLSILLTQNETLLSFLANVNVLRYVC